MLQRWDRTGWQGQTGQRDKHIFFIHFEDIPKGHVKGVCYTSVLCQHRPGKSDPDRTRITICSANIRWEGDLGTNTVSLKLFKFMINSFFCAREHNSQYLTSAISILIFQRKTWIYKNIIIQNLPRTYWWVWPQSICPQRLGIFWSSLGQIWFTAIWNNCQHNHAQTIGGRGVLRSQNYTRSMAS